MEMSWLEVLSNIDKMVLGSIVGSVVLAFLLVVVIFSVQIRSLHEVIRGLRASLDEQIQEVDRQKESLSEHTRQMKDAQIIMAHYQEVETELKKELESLQTEKERMTTHASELRKKITHLRAEKKEFLAVNAQAQEDLTKAKTEIQTVVKRNEFWVEQLSELRTKHDALLLKLRRMEEQRA